MQEHLVAKPKAKTEYRMRGNAGSPAFFPSLTQLRAFAEAARLDSISRASVQLCRSQSAVTQAIQRLESELGATLFARNNSGSFLTDVGKILRDRTEKCFARMDAAVAAVLGDRPEDAEKAAAVARRITRVQVLALFAVHQHGSFAQATRYVDVSLTSLHRSARSLERQIGRELFMNTGQGVATNKAGARLSNELLLATRELEWAEEEIRSEQGTLRGRLLIGALLLAGNHFTATILERFTALYPDVKVRLLHGSYDELLPKLRGGAIDFLICLSRNPAPVNDVIEETLDYDPYVIVSRKDHPLALKPRVRSADLLEAEWVAPRPSAQRRRVFERLFPEGATPMFNIEGHSMLTLMFLLSSSDRLALMTLSELALDTRLGNRLAAINFVVQEPPVTIAVTMREKWEPTRLQQTFLNFLRSQKLDRLAS